jgi:hypothetical protein
MSLFPTSPSGASNSLDSFGSRTQFLLHPQGPLGWKNVNDAAVDAGMKLSCAKRAKCVKYRREMEEFCEDLDCCRQRNLICSFKPVGNLLF